MPWNGLVLSGWRGARETEEASEDNEDERGVGSGGVVGMYDQVRLLGLSWDGEKEKHAFVFSTSHSEVCVG